MYQIKAVPEDFIVKEIMDLEINTGKYSYYSFKKINHNTISALELLSRKFKMPLKNFGFAGNKDKYAVTEQHISILNGKKGFENIKFRDISLEYLGNSKEPVSLGAHKGNEFEIVVRNLNNNEIKKIKSVAGKKIIVPNYFGCQRFSKSNHLIGRLIVKSDFRSAASLIAENNVQSVSNYLSKSPHDFVGALKTIPLKTRKLFVHSYQSFLFNKTLNLFLKTTDFNNEMRDEHELIDLKIPLVGFGFDIKDVKNKELEEIIERVIKNEAISPRNFIIRPMPELSSEGVLRNAFFEIKNLQILQELPDELNGGTEKIKLKFFLEKGSFATTALDFILNDCNNIIDNFT